MTLVVDASVLVSALIDSGEQGQWCEAMIVSGDLFAPDLLLPECLNVLRRLEGGDGAMKPLTAAAVRELAQLDITLVSVAPLIPEVWALRHNYTSYDASYIALAKVLQAPLATLDQRMASRGDVCEFLLPGSG